MIKNELLITVLITERVSKIVARRQILQPGILFALSEEEPGNRERFGWIAGFPPTSEPAWLTQTR